MQNAKYKLRNKSFNTYALGPNPPRPGPAQPGLARPGPARPGLAQPGPAWPGSAGGQFIILT